MTRRTKWEAALDKRRAVESADAGGQVADSMDVRMELIRQLNAGEKTLEQIQAELAAIKRSAKRNGLRTRSQVWSQS